MKWLFVLAVLLLVIDWHQTRWIATIGQTTPHPAGGFYRETNIILGPSPGLLRVNAWFAAWCLLTILVPASGPHWVGIGWALIVSIVEIFVVISNCHQGVRFHGFFK